jgi:phosphatidate cytidylyltransferase
MLLEPSSVILLAVLVALSLLALLDRLPRVRLSLHYVRHLWIFVVAFCIAEFWSFQVSVWVLAALSFAALREYFTLVDLRLQDRWAVLGAYLAIPFMTYYIQIDWYGMFIISIPVYAFLGIPFLVALGGREYQGTVFSIGAIDFGLFLLVYCVGHIGYLSLQSTWRAVFLVGAVAASDLVARVVALRESGPWLRGAVRAVSALPLTIGLAILLANWARFPLAHALALGALVPVLVAFAHPPLRLIEIDLGIEDRDLHPGKGQILDGIKSYAYAAPIVFHYCRYYLP